MLREITLGDIKLLVAFSSEESRWGDYEPLRNTSWVVGVTEITGESLSHALHGWVVPLERELGRSPRVSATRISPTEGRCKLSSECIGWSVHLCRPGGQDPHKKKEVGPPACYECPLDNPIFARVAEAWKQDRHTVVCIGEEFSLT